MHVPLSEDGQKGTYCPSSGDLLLPPVTLVASSRAVLLALPNAFFVDDGRGSFDTLAIYEFELWGELRLREPIIIRRVTGCTYAEEAIILFSPVIVTVFAL